MKIKNPPNQDISLFKYLEDDSKNKDFVGRIFEINYEYMSLLTNDFWKNEVCGIPQGSFLIAHYANPQTKVLEALLLRVIEPKVLPDSAELIQTMIEFYKSNLDYSTTRNQIDPFTQSELQYSGLKCRILGTIYKDGEK